MYTLNTAAKSVFSQYGEDGILEEIFRRCGVTRGFFVEFGAWDGQKYSNTFHLAQNHQWDGIYIEGDPNRFKDLLRNVPQAGISKLCEFVTIEGASSLDQILARQGIDDQIDLLSIDIDSDDLAVWESLQQYHPSVVVIEFNPTIPLEIEYVQEVGKNIGNSPLSLFNLGRSKGYKAVAMTRTNLIFVRNDIFPMLNVEEPNLEQLVCEENIFRVFYGYDGSLVHVGPERFKGNPWQKLIPMQLPGWMRYYGSRGWLIDRAKTLTLRLMARVVK